MIRWLQYKICLWLHYSVLTQFSFSFSGAKVKEASLQVSHSAATQLINELNYLRSNHSDVIEAEEEAKKALEAALKNHTQLKVQIEQQKTINDGYQRQMEALHTEKTNLQTNISALGEAELYYSL